MINHKTWILTFSWLMCCLCTQAQVMIGDSIKVDYPEDPQSQSIIPDVDDEMDPSILQLSKKEAEQAVPSRAEKHRSGRDWAKWHPDAKRALWLALVLPGAGQVYNRKYWKLPIIYGGFVGCIYAMTWNGQMYHDYSQAYMDISDDDPNTQSYNQFLHLGAKIDDSNLSRYQELFRKRKNRYRRWRDMSVFATIAVYALSVIDAYVDASLSEFDISDDLSLRVSPTLLNNNEIGTSRIPNKSTALGISCSLNF